MTRTLTLTTPSEPEPALSAADQARARFARRITRLALRCRERCEPENARPYVLAAMVPANGVAGAMRAHRLLCRDFVRDLRDCGVSDWKYTARLIDLLADYIGDHGYSHYRGEWLRLDVR